MTADKKSWSAVGSRQEDDRYYEWNGMYQSVLPLQNIETTFKHFMQGQSFSLNLILQQQAVLSWISCVQYDLEIVKIVKTF